MPDRPGWALERGAKSRSGHDAPIKSIRRSSFKNSEYKRMNRKSEERARFWRPLPKRGRFISQRFVDLYSGLRYTDRGGVRAVFVSTSGAPNRRLCHGF